CMTTLDQQLRSRTEAFLADLDSLVRRLALEAVSSALGAGPKTAAPAKAPKAAPAKPASKRAPAPKKAAPATKAPAKKASTNRSPGEKRPPGELAALVEKLAGYIRGNPGQGAEAIGRALGVPTREMNLPIKKLLGARRIRSEGRKRATKYFPG